MASVLCIHDRMRVDDSPDALHQHADAGQPAESHVIFMDYSSIGLYPADTACSFAAFNAADTERSLTAIIAAINAMMALP